MRFLEYLFRTCKIQEFFLSQFLKEDITDLHNIMYTNVEHQTIALLTNQYFMYEMFEL